MRSRSQEPERQPVPRADQRSRVTTAEEAETLIRSALTTLDRLEPLIVEETRRFRDGKVREALSMAMDKNSAAQEYTRCLELLKSNAIAIGRFRPVDLEFLRARHEAFSKLMVMNMAVVATARTVSEGLMRDLADTLGKNASPRTYANGMIVRKPGTTPLAVSKAI